MSKSGRLSNGGCGTPGLYDQHKQNQSGGNVMLLFLV